MNFFRSLFSRRSNRAVSPEPTQEQDHTVQVVQVVPVPATAAAPAAATVAPKQPTNPRIRELRVLIAQTKQDLTAAPGPFRKNGTPDMRYRANQEWKVSYSNKMRILSQLQKSLKVQLEREAAREKIRRELAEDPREREAIEQARKDGARISVEFDEVLCATACSGCLASLLSAMCSD
jgi:hypothetical protein